MRKRWKWIVLIPIGVAAVLWVRSRNAPPVRKLHLGPPWPDGAFEFNPDGSLRDSSVPPMSKVGVYVNSDRLLRMFSTNYSIEARSPTGKTNYDAPFLVAGTGAVQNAGTLYEGSVPFNIAVPLYADEFRVKLVLEEYGPFYSSIIRLGFQLSMSDNAFNQVAGTWLLKMHHKGVPITAWTPWQVRSNNVWVEKVER